MRKGEQSEKSRKALVLLAFWIFIASGCAPDANPVVGTLGANGEVAGFFMGLWHGFIMPFAFVGSLFLNNVGVYEVHNSGGWQKNVPDTI